MPQSQQPELGTQLMLDRALEDPNGDVLDVGSGEGKWGKLLKGKVKSITGVEIWAPNVEKYNLNNYYDHLIVEDIRTTQLNKKYDVIILGDVLEHMPKPDAEKLLIKLRENTRRILLSIPVTICIQSGKRWGNPYETHHYHWSDRELRQEQFFEILNFGVNPNGLVVIGTYVWNA